MHRNVTEADFTGATGLTAVEIGDLDGDVATLVREHRVVGLEVWRSDGVNLYADDGHRQLELLGCDEIQGYLFARPMPAGQIEGWITSHRHANESVEVPAHAAVLGGR